MPTSSLASVSSSRTGGPSSSTSTRTSSLPQLPEVHESPDVSRNEVKPMIVSIGEQLADDYQVIELPSDDGSNTATS